MNKITAVFLTAVLFVFAAVSVYADQTNDGSEENAEHMGFYAYPGMKSIKLEWKEKNGVDFYDVYRVDLNNARHQTPPMSQYEKVGTVSGNRTSWTDKEVKRHHCYGYVVRGFQETDGKEAALKYDSYMDDDCDYACPNLDRPEVLNGGNGEFETNSKDELYLYVQRDSGVRPDGVEVYRKAKGESEYQRIGVKAVEKGRFDQGKTYMDDSVVPGETYCYKVRTYKKFLGFLWKQGYSAYSKAIVIPACNFAGKFDAKAVTAPGRVKDFILQLTSDPYNGILTIVPAGTDAWQVYSTGNKEQTFDEQPVTVSGYSFNSKSWDSIPSSGLVIEAGQTVYLKFRFSEGQGYFGGNGGSYSDIYMEEAAKYDGSAGYGSTSLTIDLTTGTAEAFSDYDN